MFAEHHRQSDGGMKNRVHKSSFFHQMHALLGIEPAPQPALIRHIYHSDSQNFPPYHSSLSASPLEQTPTVEMPASMGHFQRELSYDSVREAELFFPCQD